MESAMDEELTIGKVAKLAETGIETIRFYERNGLMEAPRRRPSGYRTYGEKDVRRLRFIRRAKDLGFTLKEVKEFLVLRDKHEKKKPILALAERKLADIEEKIVALQRMKDALHALKSECAHHERDGHCALLSALDEDSRPVSNLK